MYLKIALLLSIVMQVITALIAVSLIHKTRFNVSWILLTIALLLMAIRRMYELPQVVDGIIVDSPFNLFASWMSFVISLCFLVALIFVRKIFNMIVRAENARKIMDRKVLDAIIKAEENERKRLAKELHDGLGPLLSNLKMTLSALAPAPDENQQELIRNMKQVVNESIMAIREISNNLSPHVLENFGLLSALKAFTGKVGEGSKIRFDMEENIADKRFHPNLEIALYRVLCELVTNTLKHSGATEVFIRINLSGELLLIDYYDNGAGIESEKQLSGSKGMGLSNMVSRLKSVNSKIVFNTGAGFGFAAHLTCPIENQALITF